MLERLIPIRKAQRCPYKQFSSKCCTIAPLSGACAFADGLEQAGTCLLLAR
jgi:hypothetical protein